MKEYNIKIGDRFGESEVIRDFADSENKELKCKCGNIYKAHASRLTTNRGRTCGCGAKKKIPIIIGQRYGHCIVLSKIGSKKYIFKKVEQKEPHSYIYWLCRCDCGKEYEATSGNLNNGQMHSCGCRRRGLNRSNLLEQRFGIGTVIKYMGSKKVGKIENKNGTYRKNAVSLWKLKCDCGKEYEGTTNGLRRGSKLSCGCMRQNRSSKFSYPTSIKIYIGKIKGGANNRGLIYNISEEFLVNLLEIQNYKCALSNLPISLEDSSTSLDRIDSNIGYTENNVQWVHRRVNFCKQDCPNQDFIDICHKVAETNPKNLSKS
jgi:hypothetical protein